MKLLLAIFIIAISKIESFRYESIKPPTQYVGFATKMNFDLHSDLKDTLPASPKSHLQKKLKEKGSLTNQLFFSLSAFNFIGSTRASAAGKVDFDAVRSDIANVYKQDMNRGPTLVRLAWHSSGTYDKMSKTGGSGKGTIRFKEELAHGANAGLDAAVAWLEPVHKKYQALGLSYADLYTLAGVEAIKLMNGPSIKFRAGRKDSLNPADITPDGRLPDADKGRLVSMTVIHYYKF